jgi:hypothetical protein
MGQDYPFTDPSPGANPHIYLSLLPSTGVKKPALKERGWEVEVVHLVTGQWSVREKEWLEGVAGSPQDLRDREGAWSKDPRETRSYTSQRA